MSRTIRRKNVSPPEDVIYDISWYFAHPYIQRKGKDLKKEIARYRADSYDGDMDTGRCPSYYRRMVNRSNRSKDTQELRRLNKLGLYEDHLFIHWKRDAGWDYW